MYVIYIYILYREREREREMFIYVYIYIYIHIYIYIYIPYFRHPRSQDFSALLPKSNSPLEQCRLKRLFGSESAMEKVSKSTENEDV